MEKRLTNLARNGDTVRRKRCNTTRLSTKYNSGGDDLQVHLQLKGGGRYERQVMDDSKCVSGERSMFLHTAGTQPSEWCKFLINTKEQDCLSVTCYLSSNGAPPAPRTCVPSRTNWITMPFSSDGSTFSWEYLTCTRSRLSTPTHMLSTRTLKKHC